MPAGNRLTVQPIPAVRNSLDLCNPACFAEYRGKPKNNTIELEDLPMAVNTDFGDKSEEVDESVLERATDITIHLEADAATSHLASRTYCPLRTLSPWLVQGGATTDCYARASIGVLFSFRRLDADEMRRPRARWPSGLTRLLRRQV